MDDLPPAVEIRPEAGVPIVGHDRADALVDREHVARGYAPRKRHILSRQKNRGTRGERSERGMGEGWKGKAPLRATAAARSENGRLWPEISRTVRG